MGCKIDFSLLRETLTGDIGDDWEYKVAALVLNPGPVGGGEIAVPEHTLKPGGSQPSPVTGAVLMPAGDCGTGPRVKLTLTATEVDFLVDDRGSNEIIVPMECPGPGGPPYTVEPEITARVKEAPGFLGGAASLTIKVRLVATCV